MTTLHVRTDRTLVRAGSRSTRYLLAEITAPAARAREERRPLALALVIDRSGSMAGEKLGLAKVAARRVVEALGPADRVALVQYDTRVDLLVPTAPLGAAHRRHLLAAIDAIEAGGSTNLSGGWLEGCAQVGEVLDEGALGRVLLLSDGLANHGIVDPPTLARHAGELRRRGVVTSTFGIGADFDERLMELLAREGGGSFYFIERAAQVPDVLASELGEALEVVARQAALELELSPGLSVESLEGRRVTVAPGLVRVALDDLVSRQVLTAGLRVEFPRGAEGEEAWVRVRLTDLDGALDADPAEVTWRFASHAANDAQPRDVTVDRVVAERFAARARERAAEHNREGDLDAAVRELRATARRIRAYAHGDAELLALAASLEHTALRHRERLDAFALKGERFAAYAVMESKDLMGRKRRR